jgi:hypothetical protein
MRRLTTLFLILLAGIAVPAMAQVPGPGPAPMRRAAPGVEMLLSQTGALQLTDQQVVRLAAIARRAEDRRRALRTRLDSMRPRFAPGDTAARRERRSAPPMDVFERERDAAHNDLRDALAVLTPDQQARAWELIAVRRGMPWGAGGGPMHRGDGRGGGPGMPRDGSRPTARQPGVDR